MKKAILFLMIILCALSSFSQSKKVLNAKIDALSSKIDALTSKIDAQNTKSEALNDKIISQAKEIDHLSAIIESMKSELQELSSPQQISTSSTTPVKIYYEGRCKGLTSSGSQCTRKAASGSEFCWQHDSKNTSTKPTGTSTKSSYSGSQQIQTGPRGGQYYINSKGNKTYIKK